MRNRGDILASELKNFKDCYFFLHNTKEFDIVQNIINEGFIFESQLPHSTDRVNPNEPIEITYFLSQRKDYGTYTVVIAIPKRIYEFYSAISNLNDIGIEEVLTITQPYFNENDELMYTVSPKHILGYFSFKTAQFFKNMNWDPLFNNCNTKRYGKELT